MVQLLVVWPLLENTDPLLARSRCARGMLEDVPRSRGPLPAVLFMLALAALLPAGCGRERPREGLPFDAGPPDAPGEDAGPVTCLEAEPMRGTAVSAARQCTGDGVCFELPLPFGGLLADVWAMAGDDVWAVGNSQLQHWDGTSWSRMAAPDARGESAAACGPRAPPTCGSLVSAGPLTSTARRGPCTRAWTASCGAAAPRTCGRPTGASRRASAESSRMRICRNAAGSQVSPAATNPPTPTRIQGASHDRC